MPTLQFQDDPEQARLKVFAREAAGLSAILDQQDINNTEAAQNEPTLSETFKAISDAAQSELKKELDKGLVSFNAWLNRPLSSDPNDKEDDKEPRGPGDQQLEDSHK